MSGKPERTCLYDAHVALKARMVDFHGWEMPIQYSGIIDEHTAVRTRVGLFDLSHMGRDRLLVVNASNREKDLEWMKKHVTGDVRIVDETFTTALIAIQGPRSVET